MRKTLVLMLVLAVLAPLALADEGMWLYNAPPKDQIKNKYKFDLTQQWLDHLRLSSVRFNNGGSGSFVSADGLTFTNHHVAQKCIEELGGKDKDYMKTGFYAKTISEEAKCPELELNVLQSIEDVTDKVNADVKPGISTAEMGQATRSAMAKIEKECTAATGLRCDVVTLWSGAAYHLYRYKKYTDVRLVFAPEFEAAFFGGDPDNFTYPRYDLDISFFRVYENGQPAKIKDYLKWSKNGVKENELVFVSGHPGSTGRMNTMAQMEFLRDVDYPFRLASYKQRIAMLKQFAAQSVDNARIAQGDIFGLENSQKAIIGYQSGLLDKALMAKKAAAEKVLRDWAKANGGTDPWADAERAENVYREIYKPYLFLEMRSGFRGRLAGYARTLIRAAEEKPKPNGQRLREYRDSALPSLEATLFSPAPIYKNFEIAVLSNSLWEMGQQLGADNAIYKQVLGGKTPEELAKFLIENTKLDDGSLRKQLYEGGQAAISASDDPLIKLMLSIDGEARKLRARYDNEIDPVERSTGAAISKIVFKKNPNTFPDATFTLRLSYGPVKSYMENGKKIAAFTTIGGAFEHAAKHGNKDPYVLPKSWHDAKATGRLKLTTPLNHVSTPDIIGGNSGSPVVNTNNEVVGIIFDGNIQSLPWRFMYEDTVGRSVSVDSRGIQEALRDIYGALGLAEELMGKPLAECQPTKPCSVE